MHHDTFNADFYITAATVVPVLYLALTLQGKTFELIASRHQRLHNVPREQRDRRWYLLEYTLILAPYPIIFPSVIAEFLALYAI